jgi:hypothetical protein
MLQPVLTELLATPRPGAPARTPQQASARWSRAVKELEQRGRPPADVATWAHAWDAHLQSSLQARGAGTPQQSLMVARRGLCRELQALAGKYQWQPSPDLAGAIEQAAK